MEFTKRLMDWYEEHKRVLPFRSSKNPYHIWVSEIMAQQTQIATMIPYYERWIEKYPDIESLAKANLNDILKMWEGLGYYNRARNLHKGAQFVCEHFGGVLPQKKEALMKIPGIGDYTSSAIAAIAFDEPEIAVDGNVKRVMARFLNYTENVNTRKAHKLFETYLKNELINSDAKPSDFVQALMELGALVYTPNNITCEGSPFKELCACYRGENVGVIPFIPKAKKVPSYKMSVYIYTEKNHILISKDDSDGLMKGLYRLPQVKGHLKEKEIYKLKHKFTHLTWDIKVYQTQEILDHEDYLLIPLENLDDIAMVTAHKKIITHMKKNGLL